jgi:hypothetical protein
MFLQTTNKTEKKQVRFGPDTSYFIEFTHITLDAGVFMFAERHKWIYGYYETIGNLKKEDKFFYINLCHDILPLLCRYRLLDFFHEFGFRFNLNLFELRTYIRKELLKDDIPYFFDDINLEDNDNDRIRLVNGFIVLYLLSFIGYLIFYINFLDHPLEMTEWKKRIVLSRLLNNGMKSYRSLLLLMPTCLPIDVCNE